MLVRKSIRAVTAVLWAVALSWSLTADADQPVQPVAKAIPTVRLQSVGELAQRMTAVFRNPVSASRLHGTDIFMLCLSKGTFPCAEAHSIDPTFPAAFELLCYNHQPVGPTIRIRRGETFCIHLANLLDPDPTGLIYPQSSTSAETAHQLGSTNLHTHGLHVSPDGDSDNIFVSVDPVDPARPIDSDSPYNEHLFRYAVPSDHPAGTFWYHPHRHGSVAYQLANGLAGALIVEGDKHNPRDLESISEIAAAGEHDPKDPQHDHERIVVIQMYSFFRQGADSIGRIDAQQIYNYYFDDSTKTPDPKGSASIDVTGVIPTNPTVWPINGVISPTFVIAPGEVQRWRMIYSGADVVQPLAWLDEKMQTTDEIQFNEIAVDGLATGAMTVQKELDLAPGQRSDDLIQCPEKPKSSIFYLVQLPTPNGLVTRGRRIASTHYLAKLVVQGPPQHMHLPDPTHDPQVAARLRACRPFAPIAKADCTAPSIPGGKLDFLGQDPVNGNLATATYTINGKTFHQSAPVPIDVGHAEEWTLSAPSGQLGGHPFHIHVNPFQVVRYKGPNGKEQVYHDYWRDTLFVPPGGEYTIRMYFKSDCVGDSVLHCHILDHEDQGMMMCLRFRDPNGKLAVVGPGCPVQVLAPANAPAPAIKLRSKNGKNHEFRDHITVLVFLRGLACAHCASELRDLIDKLREARIPKVRVLAICSESISDREDALRILGVTAADQVDVQIDKERSAFRDYGCFDRGEPTHGLFVIDDHATIRASYRGESPFDATSEVIQSVLRAGSEQHEPGAGVAGRLPPPR